MTKVATQKLFQTILSEDQILTAKNDLSFYGKDVSKQYEANPSIVLLPRTMLEVSEILKICNANKIAVVPSGGRTGYSGGATATNGEVILSLVKLNKILAVNQVDATVTCEAGVTTESLRNKVSEYGLYYPVDFTSKGSSHIGGNIATNAGGIRVVRYGNTREWVLGLKAVLANGEVVNCNGKLWKNQTGYDLRHLLIGSEGTLAVVVEATLKLTTPPSAASLCLCSANDASNALQILKLIRESGLVVNVFEYFERAALDLVTRHNPLRDPFTSSFAEYFLIEVETRESKDQDKFEAVLAKLVEAKLIQDVVMPQGEKQTKEILALRELIGETANKFTVPHKNDISVPIPQIPAFLKELKEIYAKKFPQYQTITFGHIGDGNLHVNVIKPNNEANDTFFKRCELLDIELFKVVKNYDGSISAEHGVGLLKKSFLEYSRTKTEISIMKGIKSVLDPNNVLNPGKIF